MSTLYSLFLSHAVDKYDGTSKYQDALNILFTKLVIIPIQNAFRSKAEKQQYKKFHKIITEQNLSVRNTYWKYATYNKEAILDCRKNKLPVYCLYCKSYLDPSKINQYCDNNTTAICYECWVDAVIPNSNRFTKEELQLWRYIGF
jgi:hypothetical protein